MDRAVLASYGWTDVDTTCGFDLDWCEAEAADDASPDTIERLEAGRYFFESAAEAQSFAAELVGIGKGLPGATAGGPRSATTSSPASSSSTSRGPRPNGRPASRPSPRLIDDDEILDDDGDDDAESTTRLMSFPARTTGRTPMTSSDVRAGSLKPWSWT